MKRLVTLTDAAISAQVTAQFIGFDLSKTAGADRVVIPRWAYQRKEVPKNHWVKTLSPKTLRFLRYTRMCVRRQRHELSCVRRPAKNGPPINTVKSSEAKLFRGLAYEIRQLNEVQEIERCLRNCGNRFKWRFAMKRRAAAYV